MATLKKSIKRSGRSFKWWARTGSVRAELLSKIVPLRADTSTARRSCNYFIRSRILARAARAHSSSNWPPGAPLTPIAPIAIPLAMMVTPPVA